MNDTTFTEKEFVNQLRLFREELGKKTFWALPENKRESFVDGIKHVWITTVRDDNKPATSDDFAKWANWIEIALTEYTRREFMMLQLGKLG